MTKQKALKEVRSMIKQHGISASVRYYAKNLLDKNSQTASLQYSYVLCKGIDEAKLQLRAKQ